MRRGLPLLATLLLVIAAAACGGGSTSDPYELLSKATNADWSPVQVNIGVSFKDGDTTVAIEPESIGIVVDETAGTGAVHIDLPVADLGIPASDLAVIGVTGDSLSLDVVWTKDAAYARSPALGTLLTMVLAGSGEPPAGDVSGWLRLGTAEELASLMELLGANAPSMATPVPAGDAAALKKQLEDAGITLKVAGSEQRDGVNATHITATLDVDKLLESDYAASVPASSLADLRRAVEEYDLEFGLWLDEARNRVVEMSFVGTSKTDPTQVVAIVVQLGEPDGTIETAVPSDFVELPLNALVQNLMELIGQGMLDG